MKRGRVWMARRAKYNARCMEGRKIDEGTSEKNKVTTISYNLLVSGNVGVATSLGRVELADHMRILERHDQEDW
jgi:hypothetical protein